MSQWPRRKMDKPQDVPMQEPKCVNCGYPKRDHDPKNGWCFNGGTGEDATQFEVADARERNR